MSCFDCSLFLIVFLVALQEDTCLQCYKCKSNADEFCGNFTTTTQVAIQECSNSDDICFHIDYNVNATKGYSQYVERKCVAPNSIICPRPPGTKGDGYCTACDTNLCNNDTTALKQVNESNDENINEKIMNNKGAGCNVAKCIPTIAFLLLQIFL